MVYKMAQCKLRGCDGKDQRSCNCKPRWSRRYKVWTIARTCLSGHCHNRKGPTSVLQMDRVNKKRSGSTSGDGHSRGQRICGTTTKYCDKRKKISVDKAVKLKQSNAFPCRNCFEQH